MRLISIHYVFLWYVTNVILVLQVGKLNLRNIPEFSQGHPSNEWEIWIQMQAASYSRA